MEAVKRALAKLGKATKPAELQVYVQKVFGIEMNRDHVKTCKGKILRQDAPPGKTGAAKPAKKPAAPKAAAPKPVVAKAKPTTRAVAMPNGVSGISLGDLQTLKELVARVGPTQLRTLFDLLAR